MAIIKAADMFRENTQTRLHYPKPRTYKYNVKGRSQRLIKLERATDKRAKGAANLNSRENRFLNLLLESLEEGKAAFTAVMATRRQKVVLENRHRQITHKALQNSLKQGFLALNQFQHSGFRTQVVSNIEKELSPLKLKKRKLQRLSKKCFEESNALCERNTAIFSSRSMENTRKLTPITERVPAISQPITIPTAEQASTDSQPRKAASTTLKLTKRPTKPTKQAQETSLHADFEFNNEDDYDEGGFTPRPQMASRSSFTKHPKVPDIGREPSVFITAPDGQFMTELNQA